MKTIQVLTVMLVIAISVNGQTSPRIIRGVVAEAGTLSPLEGVEIVAKVSNLVSGTLTDGVFAIPVSEKDSVLIFRFAGYETQEIKLQGSDDVNIRLVPAKKYAETFPAKMDFFATMRCCNGPQHAINLSFYKSFNQLP